MLARLMVGKVKEDPFPDQILQEIRVGLLNDIEAFGGDIESDPEDQIQDIRVRMLQAFMELCKDPDFKILRK